MSRRLLVVAAALAVAAVLAAPAAAAPLPAWQLDLIATPTAFAPSTEAEYKLLATNVGAGTSTTPIAIEVSLPPGVSASSAQTTNYDPEASAQPSCTVAAHLLSCQTAEAVHPGRQILIAIVVSVEAAEGTVLEAGAQISGGGALQAVGATAQTTVSAEAAPFDVLGLGAPLTDEEGLPASAAGSHPYQLTLGMYFPGARYGPEFTGAGHLRDAFGELPRGLLVDPAATPVRCTEAELLGDAECPQASQIGAVAIASSLQGTASYGSNQSPVFNMVPPPGLPASFGFNAENVGIFVHLLSGVRTDGDFGLYGYTQDILALGTHPVLSFQLQLWGDPSAPAHDRIRGACFHDGRTYDSEAKEFKPCPASPVAAALLTAPAACEAAPPRFEARADAWEAPGLFHTAPPYSAADLTGAPAPTSGCNAEPFEPTISARPTTTQADSPTGLEVDLAQATDMNKERTSPAPLRDATVTLPAGLVANPAQADGLAACSEAEIGYLAEDEEAGTHFSKAPASCPDASKLGTLEVQSPLLAQYTEAGTELVTDPETGEAIPRPLQGAVYLAKPYQNPFGTLLAIYLVLEDRQSGIVAKLAGKVIPDPATGQLRTVFEESPELPLSDIHLSLFGGARASLTTPLACGTHTTTTTLTPWSSPEGADAHPSDSFQIAGGCAASEAAAPNAPSLEAGTLSPQAGAYSPLVLKVHREDGSQRLAAIDTTLPPGLSGKLAGIATCTDAQIAAAEARSHPEEGRLERESPSCPADSEVGTVKVAAGSGPTPYWTAGHAYLSGPYKGAPLSLAVIVPAIAGPFDLGTVVTRVALNVDPLTAQIHAVSDPFPQILDGIPLDIRTVALEMGRPQFTLNPTSCEEMQIAGQATSALGNVAPLAQRFQVGGCSSLKFKPKLKLALKGGTRRTRHPALKSVLTFPKQGAFANVARAVVTLPHSEILDPNHVGSPCTRPRFAEGTCPKISILGRAKAWTPLLDHPLEGKVYFRSNGGQRPLPDIVADLRGQIDVQLIGAVDTASPKRNARIRTTFFAVPDAPVSRFELQLKGGKEGLLVNSEGLCGSAQRAVVNLKAHNGRVLKTQPLIANGCKKHGKGGGHRRGSRR